MAGKEVPGKPDHIAATQPLPRMQELGEFVSYIILIPRL